MKQEAYLIYLDRYHQGDPLFIKDLAQALAKASPLPTCLLLHGSGEKVERTLESQGYFPERENGVLQVEEPDQIRLVERATREANQEIVGTLTDEVVSSVGVQGADRSLLRLQDDGTVATGRVGWVQDLLKMHVVPVISALAHDSEAGFVREVSTAEAAIALGHSLEDFAVIVVFFTQTGTPGLKDEEGMQATASLEALQQEDVLPEPEVARRVVEAGLAVLLTNVSGLFGEEEPRGTRLRA